TVTCSAWGASRGPCERCGPTTPPAATTRTRRDALDRRAALVPRAAGSRCCCLRRAAPGRALDAPPHRAQSGGRGRDLRAQLLHLLERLVEHRQRALARQRGRGREDAFESRRA